MRSAAVSLAAFILLVGCTSIDSDEGPSGATWRTNARPVNMSIPLEGSTYNGYPMGASTWASVGLFTNTWNHTIAAEDVRIKIHVVVAPPGESAYVVEHIASPTTHISKHPGCDTFEECPPRVRLTIPPGESTPFRVEVPLPAADSKWIVARMSETHRLEGVWLERPRAANHTEVNLTDAGGTRKPYRESASYEFAGNVHNPTNCTVDRAYILILAHSDNTYDNAYLTDVEGAWLAPRPLRADTTATYQRVLFYERWDTDERGFTKQAHGTALCAP